MSLLGCLAAPEQGLLEVHRHTFTSGVPSSKLTLRFGIPLLGLQLESLEIQ